MYLHHVDKHVANVNFYIRCKFNHSMCQNLQKLRVFITKKKEKIFKVKLFKKKKEKQKYS